MSDSILEYDLSILCDDDPKSRKAAASLKRRLSAFHFCSQLQFGGALFCPGQVTDANFNACFNAAIRSKFLIAVLSRKSVNSSAAKAAALYAGNTGRKVIYICSDIASLKKARESCSFDVAYTSASFAYPFFFNSMRAKLKTELAENKWRPAKHKLLRLYSIVATAAMAMVFLFLAVVLVRFVNDRNEPFTNPEMQASILMSGNKCTGQQFISEDGQLFGDMQIDGKLLVRRTEDNTILQAIDTSFVKMGASMVFTKDQKKVLVYNTENVVLYDISGNREIFRFPLEHESFMKVLFINSDKFIAVAEGNADELYKVSIWDAGSGGLLCSYTDGDGFNLYGFTPDGRKMVGTKGENYIWTWDFFDKAEAFSDEACANIEGKVDFWPFSYDGKYYLDKFDNKKDFTDVVTTDIKIHACSNGNTLSTIQFEDQGFSDVSFDPSGRLLVTKTGYFAIYDPFSGALSSKIPAMKNSYIEKVYLIKDTRFAFCYERVRKDSVSRLYVIDTKDGRIMAEKSVAERLGKILFFPETRRIIVISGGENGRSAMLFRYDITDDGINFEN